MRVTRRAFKLALLAASLTAAVPGFAQQVSYPVEEVAAGAQALKPGDFVWQPELASTGEVTVIVSIPDQIAHVYRGNTLIGVTTVSTGIEGHETPVGRFNILQKKVDHTSNIYDAKMPYMQRLTWDGIAMHSGRIPGKPASHGCVRLPDAFAKILYGATELGASVVITDGPAAFEAPTLMASSPAAPMAPSTPIGKIAPSAPQPETIASMQSTSSSGS